MCRKDYVEIDEYKRVDEKGKAKPHEKSVGDVPRCTCKKNEKDMTKEYKKNKELGKDWWRCHSCHPRESSTFWAPSPTGTETNVGDYPNLLDYPPPSGFTPSSSVAAANTPERPLWTPTPEPQPARQTVERCHSFNSNYDATPEGERIHEPPHIDTQEEVNSASVGIESIDLGWEHEATDGRSERVRRHQSSSTPGSTLLPPPKERSQATKIFLARTSNLCLI